MTPTDATVVIPGPVYVCKISDYIFSHAIFIKGCISTTNHQQHKHSFMLCNVN